MIMSGERPSSRSLSRNSRDTDSIKRMMNQTSPALNGTQKPQPGDHEGSNENVNHINNNNDNNINNQHHSESPELQEEPPNPNPNNNNPKSNVSQPESQSQSPHPTQSPSPNTILPNNVNNDNGQKIHQNGRYVNQKQNQNQNQNQNQPSNQNSSPIQNKPNGSKSRTNNTNAIDAPNINNNNLSSQQNNQTQNSNQSPNSNQNNNQTQHNKQPSPSQQASEYSSDFENGTITDNNINKSNNNNNNDINNSPPPKNNDRQRSSSPKDDGVREGSPFGGDKSRKSGDISPRETIEAKKLLKARAKEKENLTTTKRQLSEQEMTAQIQDRAKRLIFGQYSTVSRSVCSFLQLSQIITLSHVFKDSRKMVDGLYRDKKGLDLSEYYGIIASPDFDRSFFTVFLPKWRNVTRLSLRYCSHLKASHLDRIIIALTPIDVDDADKVDKKTIVNTKLQHLNVYFCSRLGSNTLLKIRNRLVALESLNIGRCYEITANKNYNAFKQLIGSPVKKLTFSLDPSIMKDEALDVVSDLIHEQSFPNLEEVDLSHGCQILNDIDLTDLKQRVKTLKLPRKTKSFAKRQD